VFESYHDSAEWRNWQNRLLEKAEKALSEAQFAGNVPVMPALEPPPTLGGPAV
jgi:hypothetical protein